MSGWPKLVPIDESAAMRHTSEHASDRIIVYQWWLYSAHPIGSEVAAGQNKDDRTWRGSDEKELMKKGQKEEFWFEPIYWFVYL